MNIKSPENYGIVVLGPNFKYYWYYYALRVWFFKGGTNFFWILNLWGLLIQMANLQQYEWEYWLFLNYSSHLVINLNTFAFLENIK